MPEKKNAQPTFEKTIEELESIIEQIESGEIGLEECLKAYEQGTKMIKRCQNILGRAEKRIAELVADADGELKVTAEEEHSSLNGEIDEDAL